MQDFNALIRLRNDLVHVKPIEVPWPSEAEPAVSWSYRAPLSRLESRGVIQPPAGPPVPWRQQIWLPEVAQWAHAVAVQTMRAVATWPREERVSALLGLLTNNVATV
jgi:hypothetical protein